MMSHKAKSLREHAHTVFKIFWIVREDSELDSRHNLMKGRHLMICLKSST